MNFNDITYKEYRNQLIFQALSERETDETFRDILVQLTDMERGHVVFWRNLAKQKTYRVKPSVIWVYMVLRKLFGLTFVVRLMEMQEDIMVEEIREWLFHTNHHAKKDIETVLLVEEQQELKLIKQIKEERVEFMGSIVLGLNDGLIELSGALTGFLFAFQNHTTVILAGVILGISASLSMASSSYLQARQERGKDPIKSAIYTGVAYLIVVVLLIMPYLLTSNHIASLLGMLLIVIGIVSGLSFYTAVVFSRNLRQTFIEMLTFSVGTAFVTFLIGSAARSIFGINL
jgi:vacuolar iron transporter family protein